MSLLVAALVLWLVGRVVGVDELHVVAAATAALVAIAALAVRLSSTTVSVRRTVTTPRLAAGASGEVVLELRNEARVPASLLLVTDDVHLALAEPPRFVVPGITPGGTVALRYPITGAARGRYRVGPLRVRVRDAFGLTQRVRRYHGTGEVLVYPQVETLPDAGLAGSHHGSGASQLRRLFSAGDEFYTMREYVTGDDLRQVHWPSTAHRQRLMVRQQEQPWQAQATLLCDTRAAAHRGGGQDSTLERAVSVAASVLWHLAERSFELRLATEVDVRPPGRQRWESLLDRLAQVEASTVPSLAAALQGLRGSGAEGLLIAVLAPPPGDAPVARHLDTRALLQTGRAYHRRIAIVVETGRAGRAGELSGLLRTGGWRAVVLRPGRSLAEDWRDLVTARRRGAS